MLTASLDVAVRATQIGSQIAQHQERYQDVLDLFTALSRHPRFAKIEPSRLDLLYAGRMFSFLRLGKEPHAAEVGYQLLRLRAGEDSFIGMHLLCSHLFTYVQCGAPCLKTKETEATEELTSLVLDTHRVVDPQAPVITLPKRATYEQLDPLVTQLLLKWAHDRKAAVVPTRTVQYDWRQHGLKCRCGHRLGRRDLLEHGADINLPNARGETPLHRCQGNEHGEQLVALLLDRGADPNRKNADGNTPLMAASTSDYVELVRLYLAHRADTAIRNKKGQTALQVAQAHHCTHIVTLLTQAHATP